MGNNRAELQLSRNSDSVRRAGQCLTFFRALTSDPVEHSAIMICFEERATAMCKGVSPKRLRAWTRPGSRRKSSSTTPRLSSATAE
jgi:hypothetical protein